MKSIELLNYEGPVLQLEKTDRLLLIDQWKSPIAEVTLTGLISFLNGDISIADSRGKLWNFAISSLEARTDYNKIINFVINS